MLIDGLSPARTGQLCTFMNLSDPYIRPSRPKCFFRVSMAFFSMRDT